MSGENELSKALNAIAAMPCSVLFESGGIRAERDFKGTVHIKLGDFDAIQLQYDYAAMDNARQRTLVEGILGLLAPETVEQKGSALPTQADFAGEHERLRAECKILSEALADVLSLWPEDMADDGSGRIGFNPELVKRVTRAREILKGTET